MSAADPTHEDLASAREAVDEAAEALVVASRKRVPSRELAEARRKLKTAEERLDTVRRSFAKETGSVSLRPSGPEEPARRKPRG